MAPQGTSYNLYKQHSYLFKNETKLFTHLCEVTFEKMVIDSFIHIYLPTKIRTPLSLKKEMKSP